jgi:hypothetical protein
LNVFPINDNAISRRALIPMLVWCWKQPSPGYWVLKTHTSMVLPLRPSLTFGWHEAGIHFELKLRLVLLWVPTRPVLVQGWYCLKSYQPGRVHHYQCKEQTTYQMHRPIY